MPSFGCQSLFQASDCPAFVTTNAQAAAPPPSPSTLLHQLILTSSSPLRRCYARSMQLTRARCTSDGGTTCLPKHSLSEAGLLCKMLCWARLTVGDKSFTSGKDSGLADARGGGLNEILSRVDPFNGLCICIREEGANILPPSRT